MRYREDYALVDVPMLPVVKDAEGVAKQIVAYSWVMVATSLVLWPVAGHAHPLPGRGRGPGRRLPGRGAPDVAPGQAQQRAGRRRPMRLFHWSNMYLSLLFVAVALDPLIRG